MEGFAVLLVLGVLAVAVGLPIWLIVAVLDLRRRVNTEHQESTQHWSDVTARLFQLEAQLKDWKHVSPERAEETAAAPHPEVRKAMEPHAPAPAPVPPPPVREVPAPPAAAAP